MSPLQGLRMPPLRAQGGAPGSRMSPLQGYTLGFIVSNAPTGHDEIARGKALGLWDISPRWGWGSV